jgi:hypothetical protein
MLLSTSFKADLFMTHVRRIRPIVTGSLLLIALLATPLSALASGAGTIGTWQFDSDLSASTAIGSPSVAYNGYMYRFGGDDFSTAIATVQYAAINSNGSAPGPTRPPCPPTANGPRPSPTTATSM